MPFSRRDLLRSGAAGLAGAAVVGTASPEERWSYEPVAAAPVPGATDTALQGEWSYSANFRGLATYDLSEPESPEFGGYAQGFQHSRDNRDVTVGGEVASIADNAGEPGGVTFFNVSDPAGPEQIAFYAPRPASTTTSSATSTPTSSRTGGWRSRHHGPLREGP